jgi:hypothetical protein
MSDSITLTKASAECPYCPHRINQISTAREHAVSVVRDGMRKHINEEHGESTESAPESSQ